MLNNFLAVSEMTPLFTYSHLPLDQTLSSWGEFWHDCNFYIYKEFALYSTTKVISDTAFDVHLYQKHYIVGMFQGAQRIWDTQMQQRQRE